MVKLKYSKERCIMKEKYRGIFDLSGLNASQQEEVKASLVRLGKEQVGRDVLDDLKQDVKIGVADIQNHVDSENVLRLVFPIKAEMFLHELVHIRQRQEGLITRQMKHYGDVVQVCFFNELEAKAYEEYFKEGAPCVEKLLMHIGKGGDLDVLKKYIRLLGNDSSPTILDSGYVSSQMNEHLQAKFLWGHDPKKQHKTSQKKKKDWIKEWYQNSLEISGKLFEEICFCVRKGLSEQRIYTPNCDMEEKSTRALSKVKVNNGVFIENTTTFDIPIVVPGKGKRKQLIWVDNDGMPKFYGGEKSTLTATEEETDKGKKQEFRNIEGKVVCSIETFNTGKKVTTICDDKGPMLIATRYGTGSQKLETVGQDIVLCKYNSQGDKVSEFKVDETGTGYHRVGKGKKNIVEKNNSEATYERRTQVERNRQCRDKPKEDCLLMRALARIKKVR